MPADYHWVVRHKDTGLFLSPRRKPPGSRYGARLEREWVALSDADVWTCKGPATQALRSHGGMHLAGPVPVRLALVGDPKP